MELEIRVLGPVEARRHGRQLAVPGAKPRAVLTMLGLHADSTISAELLAAVLWGTEAPRTAHKALQTHISALRRVLGNRAVISTGPGWRLGQVGTDAAIFTEEQRLGRGMSSEHEEAVTHFDHALGLWRGGPVLPATARAQAELTHWTEAYDACVEERVDALLAEGHGADLIAELEAAVAAAPLRERRWVQLCLALYRAGRVGDALHAYRRARASLIDELGVEPGQELRQLEAAILAKDPALDVARPRADRKSATRRPVKRSAPVEGPTTWSGRARTRLIGRTTELSELLRLLDLHRWVTITGVGGVGKTRLAMSAVDELSGRLGPFWFVNLSMSRPGDVTGLVAERLGVVEDTATSVERSIQRHLGESDGLLLLDNCEHVLDEVGALVEDLLAECPGVRVLTTSQERVGLSEEYVLPIAPLGSEAATLFLECVRSMDPTFHADRAQVEEVCARCDGLPLAIELAAARCPSLGMDGLLAGLDDTLRLLSGSHRRTGRHRSVRAVLDWSYQLLDEPEQNIFGSLGVFADTFDLRAATAVIAGGRRGSEAELADVIGRLADRHLLNRRPGGAVSRWRMLNLVRSYARDRGQQDAALTTRYVGWAAATAQTLDQRCRAGLAWRDEYESVATDLRAALGSGAGDESVRLGLALSLVALEERRGGFAAAEEAAEEAVRIARQTGDAEELGRAVLGACLSGMLFGVTQQRRVELLSEALDALGSTPRPLRARLLARLATELYWSEERDRSRSLADEAVAAAEQADDHGALAQALYARHYVTRSPGNWPQRLDLSERIVHHGRLGGEAQLELAGRATLVTALLEAGDLAGAEREGDLLTDGAERLGHPEFQWYAATYRLVIALIRGDFEAAEQLESEAAEAARRETEYGIGLYFATAVSDLREPTEGELSEAASRLSEMAERFPKVIVWQCLRLLNDLSRRKPDTRTRRDAGRLVRELLITAEPDAHWLLAGSLLAEVISELPGTEQLVEPLETALRPYAGHLAVGGRVAAFRGSVSYALGLLALTRGDVDQAVEDLTDAAEQHERIGAGPFRARSLAALNRATDTPSDRH